MAADSKKGGTGHLSADERNKLRELRAKRRAEAEALRGKHADGARSPAPAPARKK